MTFVARIDCLDFIFPSFPELVIVFSKIIFYFYFRRWNFLSRFLYLLAFLLWILFHLVHLATIYWLCVMMWYLRCRIWILNGIILKTNLNRNWFGLFIFIRFILHFLFENSQFSFHICLLLLSSRRYWLRILILLNFCNRLASAIRLYKFHRDLEIITLRSTSRIFGWNELWIRMPLVTTVFKIVTNYTRRQDYFGYHFVKFELTLSSFISFWAKDVSHWTLMTCFIWEYAIFFLQHLLRRAYWVICKHWLIVIFLWPEILQYLIRINSNGLINIFPTLHLLLNNSLKFRNGTLLICIYRFILFLNSFLEIYYIFLWVSNMMFHTNTHQRIIHQNFHVTNASDYFY